MTIRRGGLIFINGNARRLLGDPAAVALYYNRAKDEIAVEPASAHIAEHFPGKKNRAGA